MDNSSGNSEKYDDDKSNLHGLVELTQDRMNKRALIREQSKEMQQQLREIALGNNRLAVILNRLPAGMIITCNQVITYVNDRMYILSGYTKKELLGQSTRIFYDTDEEWLNLQRLQRMHDDVEVPIKIKKKDGVYSEFSARMTRVVQSEEDEECEKDRAIQRALQEKDESCDSEFVITLYLEKSDMKV